MTTITLPDRIVSAMDTLRQPEYIGTNRCLPCTAVNVVIAAVLSVGVAVISPIAGVATILVSGSVIYLRGYLVPGTPHLTKRYLPEEILRYFDASHGSPADISDFDGEEFLLRTGVIVEDEQAEDLVLDPEFETAWHARLSAIDTLDSAATALAAMLDIDRSELDLEWHGDAFVAWHDDRQLGQWESRGAFLADVTANRELEARYDAWEDLLLSQRSQTLGLLRLFLDRCPTCRGDVRLGQDVVDSCCRSIDVVAATCQDCNDRLFEAPYEPDALAAH